MIFIRKQTVRRKHKGTGTRFCIPLTEVDIGDFNSLDLDKMSVRDLTALQIHLEDLRCEIRHHEPADRGSIEYRFWSHRLFRVEDFLACVQRLRNKLGDDSPDKPVFLSLRHLPVTGS